MAGRDEAVFWGCKAEQSLCQGGLQCSVLFWGNCFGVTFLGRFIKVATLLCKAVCLLTVGGRVKQEPAVTATLLKSNSYTRENQSWEMW